MGTQDLTGNHLIPVVDNFCGPLVKKTMAQVLDLIGTGEVKKCVFDFSICEFIDSSGIGALVTLSQEFRNHTVQMVLKNLNKDLFELFVDTGLDRIFTIEKDGDVRNADIDLFEFSVDIRLNLQKEIKGDVCIFIMSGVMNHPMGSQYFKQQLLLSLTDHKLILLDMEELTFFDSLSLSAVLTMNNLLKGTGGGLKICNANYIVQDLLTTLCINTIIPVCDTREAALEGWSSNHA
jgi:anti-sigma B factor antagonist